MLPSSSFRRIAVPALVVASLVAACGDDSTGPDTTPAEVLVASVDTLRSLGATATLTATVRNKSHEPIPGAAVSSWESSDPAVVTVDPITGVATALANGEATVTARAGELAGTTRVVVRQRIDLSRSTIGVTRPLLFVGETVRVTLTLRDARDNPITPGAAAVAFSGSGGTSALTLGPTVDQGNGTYTSDVAGAGLGTAQTVGVSVDGTAIAFASAPTLRVVGFTKIAAWGSDFAPLTCGIITTGDMYCWGEPMAVARGTNVAGVSDPGPTLVTGGHRWADVEVRGMGGCGITEGGKLYCWGNASQGALGNGTTVGDFLPIAILPESSFVSVDIGQSVGGCAVTTGRTAMCWGMGTWGRLGNGADADVVAPVRVSGGHRFAAVGTSNAGTCGVTEAGTAMCWGYYGALGIGAGPYPDTCAVSVACAKTPVTVSGGITFTPSVVHDGSNACATATNGKTYCWGVLDMVPREVPGAPVFTSIVAAFWDRCGIGHSGTAYCWGRNQNGRFGQPADWNEVHPVPEPVPGGQRFTQLSMGTFHMCGVATDGNAWCWGKNDKGQLGDRTTTRSDVPVRVKLFAP